VGHLSISDLTPTVSTIAESWKEKIVVVNPTFRKVRWNQKVKVDIITLDELIVLYGVPTYCKIDVEGYEGKVLQGLSHPIKLVSFEFIYGDLESTISCVELLETLGVYEFNIVIGENRKFQFSEWVDKELLLDRLSANQSSSGDLYARLM
jgi:hypothetical protein